MRQSDTFLKNLHGNVAVEFALVLPVIFLLLSGVINFGLILGNQNQLNAITSAGVLYAFGNAGTAALVQTTMTNTITNPSVSPLTVTATKECICYPTSGAPSGLPTAAACTASCTGTLGTYMYVTAISSVSLIALDFVLTNPFPTTASAYIRTN